MLPAIVIPHTGTFRSIIKDDDGLDRMCGLVCDFDDFIRIDIHDLRLTTDGFRGRKITALKMSVSVKVVTRLGNAYQPIDGFESLMGLGLFIVNSKRRRVCNEYIERASVVDLVQHEAR